MTCLSPLLCVHSWDACSCLKQSETSVHVRVAMILSDPLKMAFVEDFQAYESGSQGWSHLSYFSHPPC